uniref:Dynein light chain n=1 Tax=Acrobeloides nanus TaxID=290746 RepID=A0A914D510_9BILA
MSSATKEDAVTWTHEALKIYTSRDGTSRESFEICKFIKRRFEEKHTGHWGVSLGRCASSYTYYNDNNIKISIDNNEYVMIFQSSPKQT